MNGLTAELNNTKAIYIEKNGEKRVKRKIQNASGKERKIKKFLKKENKNPSSGESQDEAETSVVTVVSRIPQTTFQAEIKKNWNSK